MPNPYFQFKQFVVYHDRCAMKVCTDACILGAWFAGRIAGKATVLDIGAGSGLLTLMLAQKNQAVFHGIEIDAPTVAQARQNVADSPWNDAVQIFCGDAAQYPFPEKYDCIITNPPFYANDLRSGSMEINLARHDSGLPFGKLIDTIDRNLSEEGSFGILLPYHRTDTFEALAAAQNFFPVEKLRVKQTPGHPFFRTILHFMRGSGRPAVTREMTIKTGDGKYSADFTSLLKDYYLHL